MSGINNILHALHTFESNVLPQYWHNKTDFKPHIARASWTIQRRFLRHDIAKKLCGKFLIPGFQIKDTTRFFLGKKRVVHTPHLMADATQTKGDVRIRAFYIDNCIKSEKACSVKLLSKRLGCETVIEDLYKEVDNRQLVEQMDCVVMPRLLGHGEIDDYVYVVEDLVKGRRFSLRWHMGIFIRQGIPQLFDMYKKSGLSLEPLADFLNEEKMEKLDNLTHIYPDIAELRDYLKNALDNNELIDVALCHGDLASQNLCVRDGVLYFLDWGSCARGSIVADSLHMLMRNIKKSEKAIKQVLETVDKELGAGRHYLAFSYVIANEIIRNPDRQKELYKLWQKYS